MAREVCIAFRQAVSQHEISIVYLIDMSIHFLLLDMFIMPIRTELSFVVFLSCLHASSSPYYYFLMLLQNRLKFICGILTKEGSMAC